MVKVAVEPVGKPRQSRSDRWRQRPAVMRYRAFCDELRLRLPGFTLPDTVGIIFYIPMPASWSKKKREKMDGTPHQSRPDIDNLIKSVMDALAKDDSYVWQVGAQKVWATSGAIEIEDLEG